MRDFFSDFIYLFAIFLFVICVPVGVLCLWRYQWPWQLFSRSGHRGEKSDSKSAEEVNKWQVEGWLESAMTKKVGSIKNFQAIPYEIQMIQKEIHDLKRKQKKSDGNWDSIYKKLRVVEIELMHIRQTFEKASVQAPKPYNAPEQIRAESHYNSSSLHQEPCASPSPYREIGPPPSTSPPVSKRSRPSVQMPAELVHSYNQGIIDSGDRDTFQTRYKPIRVKTANALQRQRDSNLSPEFHTHHAGDYYAVEFEEGGQKRYAVLPRFGLTFDAVSFGPGAIGEVFDCGEYNSGLQYHQAKVIQPAIFEPDGDQGWRLVEKGRLDLGQGE
ncbi:MAG: hypothetical protein V7641_1788 [Blastocatellia bacterium]